MKLPKASVTAIAIATAREKNLARINKQIKRLEMRTLRLQSYYKFWKEAPNSEVLMQIDIRDIFLPKSIVKALRKAGYHTISAIVQNDPSTIGAIKGIGTVSMARLQEFFVQNNIIWK